MDLDILIFDMDGVLIDVSKSYRRTIQRTVQIYFKTCLGFQNAKENLVTEEDISLFKTAGGFNNDWDLTSGLLLYMLSISDIPPFTKRKIYSSVQEIVPYLREKSSGFLKKNTIRSNRKHFTPFIKEVKASGGGLNGVRRALNASWDGWVYRSGDIDQENVVKRIFQEVYLGKKFNAYYHLPPLFYRGQGYYLREKPIIPKKILTSLRKKLRMGIASGRPRFEAELALKRFHLLPYFDSVVTLDECLEEEKRILLVKGRKMKFSKPHPYSILRTIQEMGLSNPYCGYIGDVVDDMLAAQAAKKDFQIVAIGFLAGRSKRKTLKESLLRAGADIVIENPRDLLHIVD
jgi:HAD superfamily hydrolase (TIGR01548 family)